MHYTVYSILSFITYTRYAPGTTLKILRYYTVKYSMLYFVLNVLILEQPVSSSKINSMGRGVSRLLLLKLKITSYPAKARSQHHYPSAGVGLNVTDTVRAFTRGPKAPGRETYHRC